MSACCNSFRIALPAVSMLLAQLELKLVWLMRKLQKEGNPIHYNNSTAGGSPAKHKKKSPLHCF